MFYIYTLGDPRNGDIYYVGKTQNPTERWISHKCANGFNAARERNAAIRDAGAQPVMVILSRHESTIAADLAEVAAIFRLRKQGHDLLNKRCLRTSPSLFGV